MSSSVQQQQQQGCQGAEALKQPETSLCQVQIEVLMGKSASVQVPVGTTWRAALQQAGVEVREDRQLRRGAALIGLDTPVQESCRVLYYPRITGGYGEAPAGYGGIALGVFWAAQAKYGVLWGLAYALFWPTWLGYRAALWLLG